MEHLFVNTLLALLLGAAIGLRGELDGQGNKNILGGFRTHAFLALVGAISGIFILSENYVLPALLTGSILMMIVGYYVSGVVLSKAYGITSEITAIFAHFIGILLIVELVPVKYVIAISVIIIFIVTRKSEIRNLTDKLSKKEIIEFSLFAIISLVILPYLPNKGYSINYLLGDSITGLINNNSVLAMLDLEIINPFKTWFIVVFVSGIDLAGYLMTRFISSGNSQFISSTIGGFVSSTSTTLSLAIQSKKKVSKKEILLLVAAALSANAASFIQVLILVAPISMILFQEILIPAVVMIVGGFAFAIIVNAVNKNDKKHPSEDEGEKQSGIFELGPALKFAILLTVVKFAAKASLILLGKSAFIITSMIAAFTGIDAVMITLSDMVNTGQVTITIAMITFMAANFVNLASKVGYSFISGNKLFAKKFALYIGIVFIIALIFAFKF